jgi:hypothetical protein
MVRRLSEGFSGTRHGFECDYAGSQESDARLHLSAGAGVLRIKRGPSSLLLTHR